MKSLICVLLSLAVVSAISIAAKFENGASEIVEDPKTLFLQFTRQFEKRYTTAEIPIKFSNFKASIERINKLNRESPSAVFAINQFSDMSTEEFKTTILMKNPITPKEPAQSVQPARVEAPDSWDWRPKGAVTPVKNQEQCGSCWAFSATEAVESAWILAGKATNETVDLGPQQIVDCDTTSDGCNGGETESAYNYLIQAGGQESNTSYPYTGQDGTCAFKKSEVVSTIASFKPATSDRSETTLQSNLISWGPVSICVDASSWQDYQKGVMTHFQCAIFNVLDHCVQLVGYNATSSPAYWIVRNSWTTQWGIEGYIWLEMWHDTCGLTKDATWPTI